MERGAARTRSPPTAATSPGSSASSTPRAARGSTAVSVTDLSRYLGTLRRRGLGSRSVARHLSAVRGLYRFLLDERARSAAIPPSTSTARARRAGCRARCRCEDAAALVEAPDTTPARRAARPRPARAALRLRAARLGGLGAAARGRQLRGRLRDRAPARAAASASCRSGAQALDWVRRYLAHVAPASQAARRPAPLFLNRSGGAAVAPVALDPHPARGAARRPPQPRSRRTPCATPSRATCSSAAPTCARCRPCWATPTSRRPRSTRTCRRAWSATCTGSSTPARALERAASEPAEMAQAGHAYPQVEPARGRSWTVARGDVRPARRACARRSPARAPPGAAIVVAGPARGGAARRARARGRLGARPAARPRDRVARSAGRCRRAPPRSTARRLLLAGALAGPACARPAGSSAWWMARRVALAHAAVLGARAARAAPATGTARRGSGSCARRASSARALGAPVYAVGGFVRDLLLGAPRARPTSTSSWRATASPSRGGSREEIGGHACWCTAASAPRRSKAAAHRPAPASTESLGRVDVATARRERYAAAGRAAGRGAGRA